jgi:hypothetical protein
LAAGTASKLKDFWRNTVRKPQPLYNPPFLLFNVNATFIVYETWMTVLFKHLGFCYSVNKVFIFLG